MGSLAGKVVARRSRFVCLHRFRTSDGIMLKQVVGNWPAEVTACFDLVFTDRPFPAEGMSDVDDIIDQPYYEWFGGASNANFWIGLDSAAIAVTDRVVLLGTHDGTLHILDFQVNQTEALKEAIIQVVADAKEKNRKFTETVELQIGLKNYDLQKDKRFSGSVKLPHILALR
ncbi:dihydrofolate reductase-like [Hordeum vulgare]|nr:dihydrofolate reductase-like [Hordeum vulgare]